MEPTSLRLPKTRLDSSRTKCTDSGIRGSNLAAQVASTQDCTQQPNIPDGFDPYHKWLGIRPEEQPPSHYRLLGIGLFESDRDVIQNSGDQRMAYLKTVSVGRDAALSERLLNQVSAAMLCLLDPEEKRAYDDELQTALAPKANAGPGRALSCPHCAQPVVHDPDLCEKVVSCPRCTHPFTMSRTDTPTARPVTPQPPPVIVHSSTGRRQPAEQGYRPSQPSIESDCPSINISDERPIASQLRKRRRSRMNTPHPALQAIQIVLGGIGGLLFGWLILRAICPNHPIVTQLQETVQSLF